MSNATIRRPIENVGGAIIATGTGISMFRLLSLRGAMKLENLGMSCRAGRWGEHVSAMVLAGIEGKATAKNRKAAEEWVEAQISQVGHQIEQENDAIDRRN